MGPSCGVIYNACVEQYVRVYRNTLAYSFMCACTHAHAYENLHTTLHITVMQNQTVHNYLPYTTM